MYSRPPSQLAPNTNQASPSHRISIPFNTNIHDQWSYHGSYRPSNYSSYSPVPVTPSSFAQPVGIPPQSHFASHNGVLLILKRSLAVFFLIVGLSTVAFLYIFLNRSSWDGEAIQTAAPLGNVLLLFNICSKAVLICLPLVMSSAAYHIADAWIKRSRDPIRRDLPTPYQYTLLLSIFTGANIFSAWNTLKYFFRSPIKGTQARPDAKRSASRGQTSYPLEISFATLFITLIIAYAIVAIDFSLHDLSSVVLLPKNSINVNPKSALYGRVLKDECLEPNLESGLPCTIRYDWGTGVEANTNYIIGYQEVLKILLGSSTVNRVVSIPYEDSDVAALVPASDATLPDSSYTANTIGLQAQCVSTMNSCGFDEDGTLSTVLSEGYRVMAWPLAISLAIPTFKLL
jgi:hypothetical protein